MNNALRYRLKILRNLGKQIYEKVIHGNKGLKNFFGMSMANNMGGNDGILLFKILYALAKLCNIQWCVLTEQRFR